MGGDRGGRIIAQGTPEQVALVDESFTGQYLSRILPTDRIEAARGTVKRNGTAKRAVKVGGLKVNRPAPNGNGKTATKAAAKKAKPAAAAKNGRSNAKAASRGR
jgi:excinuclease ABC subunit A